MRIIVHHNLLWRKCNSKQQCAIIWPKWKLLLLVRYIVKMNFHIFLVGKLFGSFQVKKNRESSPKIKNRSFICSSCSTSWHIYQQYNNLKRHMNTFVHYITKYNSHDMEATQTSNNRWIDKEVVECINNTILCSYKKR